MTLRLAPTSARPATAGKSLDQGRLRLGLVAACTVAFIVTGGASRVLACPMCFGAEETSMIDGTKVGIFVLLVITLGVQGAFAGFFFYLRNRAKRIADDDLDTAWSKLQSSRYTS